MKRIILYTIGMLAFALGCKFFVDSNMGTDPLDVLLIGIKQHTGLLIGHIAWAITFLFIAIYGAITRKLPHWTSFVTAPICGYILDFLNWGFPNTHISDPKLILAALTFCSFGSALIIASRYGIRIMDLVVIAVSERTKMSFAVGKIAIEVALLLGGWALGGPFGIATVAFVLLIGPLVQAWTKINARLLGTPSEIAIH